MIWNESIECMDRESLRKIQSIRLKKIVDYVYHNTPFYRKKMQEMGITPDDINSIDDIVKLPFTTKHDLRDNYPFGLCAVPMSQIVRIHASSGTTGKPTVVGYTRKDLASWAECISRAFTAYGAGRSDIFQVSYGYGLFTGGLGAHAGAENIGASVIPMSSGNTEKQITLMHDFGSTVLCCTPSYALYLADAIKDSGLPREEFQLKVGAFGAEPWTENMRHEIEEKLGIKAYDIFICFRFFKNFYFKLNNFSFSTSIAIDFKVKKLGLFIFSAPIITPYLFSISKNKHRISLALVPIADENKDIFSFILLKSLPVISDIIRLISSTIICSLYCIKITISYQC